VDVVRCASLKASSKDGWTRVIVEKPFGRDSESSSELTRSLKQYLTEDQIFRFNFLFFFLFVLFMFSSLQVREESLKLLKLVYYLGLTITWVRSLWRISPCFVFQILFLSLYGPGITFVMCS